MRMTEAVAQRCSVKKVFLQISQNPQENTHARVSFARKMQAEACNFIKKDTLAQMFSCKFLTLNTLNFNALIYRIPPVTASGMGFPRLYYKKSKYLKAEMTVTSSVAPL